MPPAADQTTRFHTTSSVICWLPSPSRDNLMDGNERPGSGPVRHRFGIRVRRMPMADLPQSLEDAPMPAGRDTDMSSRRRSWASPWRTSSWPSTASGICCRRKCESSRMEGAESRRREGLVRRPVSTGRAGSATLIMSHGRRRRDAPPRAGPAPPTGAQPRLIPTPRHHPGKREILGDECKVRSPSPVSWVKAHRSRVRPGRRRAPGDFRHEPLSR